MKVNKAAFVFASIITVSAFVLVFELAAHADPLDEATTITFSDPIQIPGRILPPGTYLFRLADNDANRNVVQIFNADGNALYATLLAIPTERTKPTGDTAITFAEQAGGKPDAILKWFYPGSLTGHEFVYSTQEERELAQDSQQTVLANEQPVPNSGATGLGR